MDRDHSQALDPEPTDAPSEHRKPRVRGVTISVKRLAKRDLDRARHEATITHTLYGERPQTREDCLTGSNAMRPCPWVSCKWHLALDVNPKSGGIKINLPDETGKEIDWAAVTETCALDVADRGGDTLEAVGAMVGLTRERVRQVEMNGLTRLRALSEIAAHQEDAREVHRPDLQRQAGEDLMHSQQLQIATDRVLNRQRVQQFGRYLPVQRVPENLRAAIERLLKHRTLNGLCAECGIGVGTLMRARQGGMMKTKTIEKLLANPLIQKWMTR